MRDSPASGPVLRLAWRTADPRGSAWRLASAVGGHVDEVPHEAAGEEADGTGGVVPIVRLVDGQVAFVEGEAGMDRLELAASVSVVGSGRASRPARSPSARAAAARGPETDLRGAPLLLGIGWATVDADRALPGVAGALGLARDAFRPGDADQTLGADAHVARLGPLMVAVLEPTTEGRVAAALARSGEGPCALYVGTPASGESRPGPLGPAILVMADRRSGPFVLALRRRALGRA